MDVKDKVVIVTGGASGIGKAMCTAFAQAGARGVVVADLDVEGATAVAQAVGGMAFGVDVANESEVQQLVDVATGRFGQVDVFCSNAGVIVRADEDAPVAEWHRHWHINVMAHVHAAQAVLPQMIARGEGYLVQTASAAGLLSQVNAAPYSVHQACGRRFRRMAVHRAWRPGHPRELPLPAGRVDADVDGHRRQPARPQLPRRGARSRPRRWQRP